MLLSFISLLLFRKNAFILGNVVIETQLLRQNVRLDALKLIMLYQQLNYNGTQGLFVKLTMDSQTLVNSI